MSLKKITKILNIFLYGPVTLTKAEEVRNCWVHGTGRVFYNDSTEGECSEEPKCSLFTNVKSKHQNIIQTKTDLT